LSQTEEFEVGESSAGCDLFAAEPQDREASGEN
jgi:hypothetical protein